MSLHAELELTVGGFGLDVSVDAAAGETVAILGPNGAGKTTLLRAIAGLLPLERGAVRLADAVLDDPAAGIHVPPERRSIGMVFQQYLLFPHLSVLENVAFGLRARRMSGDRARSIAREWLVRMDLSGDAERRPSTLSGGEAQRVALARALAPNPRLLLLDEPLAALDVTTRARVRRDLRAHLAAFEGVRLLVTHDPVDALALADRVVVIDRGRVVQKGTVDEVSRWPRSRFVAELVGINLVHGAASDGLVRFGGGVTLTVPDRYAGDVFVAVRPASIALYRERPNGSPRNVWRAVIEGIDQEGDRCRVRLGGPLALVAEVTSAAAADLSLAAGAEVWASVKAMELAVYPA